MSDNTTVNTTEPTLQESVTSGDAAWILSNAFLILTMQTGFGMLEAGFVSMKNVTNIMVKNVVDVCLGGLTYWAFGYGLSFGTSGNSFVSWGNWFATSHNTATQGTFYTHYVFQFSFATAATTIVSGAIAERMKFNTYMIFSVLNTFVYCLPVAWAWNSIGFLAKMGFHDFAGACVVHMSGGASALVAAWMVGPRMGRFDPGGDQRYAIHSPVTALTGTFMLWWAWLAFNCGSTFAIEGNSWKVASKVGVTTLNGSIGGGLVALFYSAIKSRGHVYRVDDTITGVLAGLVAITAGCAVLSPTYALLVGAIGSVISLATTPMLQWMKIDDPVGAAPVHFFTGAFSTLAVGLFGHSDFGELQPGRAGVFINGDWEQLWVQAVAIVLIAAWSGSLTFLLFLIFYYTIGYRVSIEDETLGADWVEHDIRHQSLASQMEQALASALNDHKVENVENFISKFVRSMLEQDEDSELRHMTMPGVVSTKPAPPRPSQSQIASVSEYDYSKFLTGSTQGHLHMPGSHF